MCNGKEPSGDGYKITDSAQMKSRGSTPPPSLKYKKGLNQSNKGGGEMAREKTESEIEAALRNLPADGSTKYPGMTYEEGIDEALRWVLGEIPDEDFEYTD